MVATVALLAGLSLGACQPKGADDDAFGQKVRAYLLSHPEVLVEASQKLEARMAANEEADQKTAAASLPRLRAAIERDPRDFVANPNGRITVTEFYDYRCPHCVTAAPKVLALIQEQPDVRFVFKEMPIFGPASEHAAKVALAVRRAGGDSLGLYKAFMAARPLDEATADRLALRLGARPEDIRGADSAEARAQLAQTDELFTKLALGGTPAFVIGDRLLTGDNMADVQAAIAQARGKPDGKSG